MFQKYKLHHILLLAMVVILGSFAVSHSAKANVYAVENLSLNQNSFDPGNVTVSVNGTFQVDPFIITPCFHGAEGYVGEGTYGRNDISSFSWAIYDATTGAQVNTSPQTLTEGLSNQFQVLDYGQDVPCTGFTGGSSNIYTLNPGHVSINIPNLVAGSYYARFEGVADVANQDCSNPEVPLECPWQSSVHFVLDGGATTNLHFTVGSIGTVTVTSNLPTTWNVVGPASWNGSCSTLPCSIPYNNKPAGTYSIGSADDIPCYDLNLPNSQTLTAGGNITLDLDYEWDGSCGGSTPATADLKFNNSNGPLTINSGDSGTLSWTSSGASSCYGSTLDGVSSSWIGGKALSGSQTVSNITTSTAYTLHCWNTNGGDASDTVSVTVNGSPPPTGCSYSISPTSANLTYNGGSGTVTVTASSSSCSWVATSNKSFLTITSGSSGTGNGSVHYTAASTVDPRGQSGTLTIAGQTFTVTESGAPYTCTDDSTITVTQALPSTLQPGQTASVTFHVIDSGNTRWYRAQDFRFIQNGSSLTIKDPSTGLTYGKLINSIDTQNGSVDWTFTVTAPTTPGSYTLYMQMEHLAGAMYMKFDGTTCTYPSSDTPFGDKEAVSFTVPAPVVSSINYSIVYTPKTLNAPTSVTLSNATCSQMNVTWTYTDNGTENGFYVYRSTDDLTWTKVSTLLPIATRSYTDATVSPGTVYYYRVSAHRGTTGIDPQEVNSSSPEPSAMAQACLGNLSASNKTIDAVNGTPYGDDTVIQNGDTITYRIFINNAGPSNVSINYICENPSDNLTNITNLQVTGSGATNNGITYNDPTCLSQGGSGTRFNVSGTKDLLHNWILTFDATLATSGDQGEKVTNNAVIHYTDSEARQKTVTAPNLLIQNGGAKVPIFREVAP